MMFRCRRRGIRTAWIGGAFLLAAAPALAQSTSAPPAKGVGDSSQGTLCWDVLTNVARERNEGAGRVKPSGDYAGQHSGSNENRKVQGPGAEPKDPTGVTVGESTAARQGNGGSIRPSGLPNC